MGWKGLEAGRGLEWLAWRGWGGVAGVAAVAAVAGVAGAAGIRGLWFDSRGHALDMTRATLQ